jgi:hypothetical protein
MLPFWSIREHELITRLHNATQHNTLRLRPHAAQPFGARHAPQPGVLFDAFLFLSLVGILFIPLLYFACKSVTCPR